jgi:hypothetical protein
MCIIFLFFNTQKLQTGTIQRMHRKAHLNVGLKNYKEMREFFSNRLGRSGVIKCNLNITGSIRQQTY